ncbi:MAG: type IV pilus secretin PilQ [Candidatus Acidiferrales bacterium]|jgi:type IV pilus assembly protein PilQ
MMIGRAWGLGALVVLGLILSNGTLSANDGAAVRVKAQASDGMVRLEVKADVPFEYTTYRASESLYVIDLAGVSAGDAAGVRVVPSDLLKSYRLSAYTAGGKPVVRLEVLLNSGVQPKLERTDAQDLDILVSRDASAEAGAVTHPVIPAEKPAAIPVAIKTAEGKSAEPSFGSIQQVNLAENGDQTNVNVLGSGPLNYRASHLQNPDRIVLDFSGSSLNTSVRHIASNLDPVREIRLAQFTPEISRVVIDLRQPARYNINTAGNAVTVVFEPSPSGGAAANSATSPETSNLMRTKSKIESRAPEQLTPVKAGEVPLPAAALPEGLTQNSSALATRVPAAPQSPMEAAAVAATLAKPAPASQPAGPAAAESPAPAPAVSIEPRSTSAQQAQTPAPAANGKYSGEPISVNLKDVDLRDFFRLIHEISGLNVVVDPSVKGALTIVLDDVPWDQALDIVLHNNDLDKQLEGNVLRIATKDTLRKEAEESRDLARAQAEAADIVTTTRRLSYAKATSIAITMKKFLSARGDILADDRSNTLIIRDIPSTFPVLDNLLRQLDRRSQQVEIEARVVAANRSFSRELGTELGISTRAGNNAVAGDNAVGASPTTFTPSPPVVVGTGGTSTTGGQIPLLTSLETTVPTSGIQYLFASPNFALDFVIDAAEQRGVGKLLSKPKVITQNNEKATVKQGTKIPVQTVVNNTVSVQFVDAVLELDVTPQITADGTVYMDVTVQNDQIDQAIPRVQGIPAIDTQSAETKVTVTDGATVVIGGIIVTQQQTAISQVPLVGSIPVLGNLFKHTTVSSTSQELLFFLTPRILPM